mmetsp:Transcript_139590/g.242902  ORF Transcript_139590/g.242902 Transcript_139590/m.242902 type:complete len:82 (+) Transcript_139590:1854-2099(+)
MPDSALPATPRCSTDQSCTTLPQPRTATLSLEPTWEMVLTPTQQQLHGKSPSAVHCPRLMTSVSNDQQVVTLHLFLCPMTG